MIFQWDEKKDLANQAKHRLSFADSVGVFADPFAVSRIDRGYEGPEERRQIIGHINGIYMVMVVYTMRAADGEEVIRVISARRATAQEKRSYENGTWF